jgi:hypothetical protein
MKHVELHAHYLRQLVQKTIAYFVYCRTNDHITSIFMNPFIYSKFVELLVMIGIYKVTIMGGV